MNGNKKLSMSNYQIGQTVIILPKKKCGTISYIDLQDQTIDVIYDGNNEEEEDGISFDRIWIEKDTKNGMKKKDVNKKEFVENNERSKKYFQAKNYLNALESYKVTLNSLKAGFLLDDSGKINLDQFIGFSVLVKIENLDYSNRVYLPGYIAIADTDKQTVDLIMFGKEEEELDDVNIEKLVLISPSTFVKNENNDTTVTMDNIGQLQCNLYLNLARCSMKLQNNVEAIMYCTVSIALANFILKRRKVEKYKKHSNTTISKDTWIKAFYLRSRSHLNMLHFKQAKQDAKKIQKLDPNNEDFGKILSLIEKRQKRQMIKDKHLIKQMCKHVQTAMDSNKEMQTNTSGNNNNNNNGDVSSTTGKLTNKQNDKTTNNKNPESEIPWIAIVSIVVMIVAGCIF